MEEAEKLIKIKIDKEDKIMGNNEAEKKKRKKKQILNIGLGNSVTHKV